MHCRPMTLELWAVVCSDLKLQVEEVECVERMTMDEIFQRFEKGEKFAADSIAALRLYQAHLAQQTPAASSK